MLAVAVAVAAATCPTGLACPSAPMPPGSMRNLSLDELKRGVARLGSAENVARLLHRLREGRPVTVGVLGSSVAQMGGCLWQPGERCANYAGRGTDRDLGLFRPRHGAGFAVRFFRWLNSTWPHAGHRLYNGGLGMTPPQGALSCLFTHVPTDAHLVILEFGSTAAGLRHAAVEAIARALLSLPHRPALVFLSVREWCGSVHSGGAAKYDWREGRGILFKAEQATPWSKAEATFSRVADAYGLGVLSTWHALYARAVADGGGRCPCGRRREVTLPYVPTDCLHPTTAALGAESITQLLRHWLTTAAAATAAPGGGGAHDALARAPLFGAEGEAPRDGGRARCYGFGQLNKFKGDVDTWRTLRGLMWHTAHCAPNAIASGAATGGGGCDHVDARVACDARKLAERAPPVWFYCSSTLGANPKRDPGVVALAPGATLDLPIDTRLVRGGGGGSGGEDESARMRVGLKYLASYEHMGTARVECARGCTCEPTTIDAHRSPGPGERPISLALEHSIVVVGALAECTLRVRVLDATASGGHKFKLTQVSVRNA